MKEEKTRWGLLGIVALPFVAGAVILLWPEPRLELAAVSADDLALGEAVYAENCASCHGTKLEGQDDWQTRLPSGRMPAPPHDIAGHTWHHPDAMLVAMTREGAAAVIGNGYESDMPAFGEILSDAEIEAVLTYIKSTWPAREQEYQAEMTRQASPS